jgi:chitodextrinase
MNRTFKTVLSAVLCLFMVAGTCFFGSLDVQAETQGNGLKGDYFDNKDLTDLKLTRIDTNINFDWGDGSPDSKVSSDTFSVRWTGYVQPNYSETYTFYTSSDDGVRLWVNNQLLVDKWVDQGETEYSGSITLTAGVKYSIKLEYYEGYGGAAARLKWASSSQSKQVVPKEALYSDTYASQLQLDLSSYYNEDAFSYDSKRNDGSFDGLSSTYSADLVNKTQIYDGVSYSFGSMGEGSRNSIGGKGQTIAVSETLCKSVRLLGSATQGDQTGTFRIRYSDGSYSDFSITQKDWCASSITGQNVYQTMNHRHADTADQIISTYIYAYYIIPSSDKKVTGITLPDNEDMHVLAVSLVSLPSTDTQAPSTPSNLTLVDPNAVRQTSSRAMALSGSTPVVDWPYTAVTLEWSASTDNVGVTGYEIYRDNQKIGTTSKTTYTDTNLTIGTTYTYTVRAYDAADNKSALSSAISAKITAAAQNGIGLRGEYYNNKDLTEQKLTRIDSNVNFDWGSGSPDSGIGGDTFSVRWTGQIIPKYTETYTFHTISDDGVRLWVNNQLIIERWNDQGATEYTGKISLSAGTKYDIKLEYYENQTDALVKLLWSSNSQSKEIIPKQYLYPSTATDTQAPGTPTNLTLIDPSASLSASLRANSLNRSVPVVEWPYNAVTLEWSASSDNVGVTGYEVYRNDEKIGTTGDTRYTDRNLRTGSSYTYKVRAYDAAGNKSDFSSSLGVKIKQTIEETDGTGLKGEYYDNKDLTKLKIARVDASINFDWDKGSPHWSIAADTFSVRWTGQIVPRYSEEYTFHTKTDDGVRLWVDGRLIINKWNDQSSAEHSAKIWLEAGKRHNIKMEYYDSSNHAVAKLYWSSSSQQKEIVPQNRLYPTYTGNEDDDRDHDEDDEKEGRGLTGKYYDNKDFTKHKLTRVDETINFNWRTGSPDKKIKNDTYSIRWTGRIKPDKSGSYTFYTAADDGVRLWVNNRLIINDWRDHSATEKKGTIYLEAGDKYDIKLEYYENQTDSSVKLMWSGPDRRKQIIARKYLYTE